MTSGFSVDPASLRQRSRDVAALDATMDDAAAAAVVASDPDAFGVLCSALPGLLAPATEAGRAVLAEGATTLRAIAGALDAAAAAYERGDQDTAAGFLGER